MKFFAEPNLFIRIANKHMQRLTGKKGFYFDDKGEFITDNQHLINALKTQFKFEDNKLPSKDISEAKNTVFVEGEVIASESKEFKCEYCDFETNHKGAFGSHIKKHKREE